MTQLSQVLLRNSSRYQQNMNNQQMKILLQNNCTELWNRVMKNDPSYELPSSGNRFTELCSVCGYGYYAPIMNNDISLEENQFGKAVRLNSLRYPSQTKVVTRNSKVTYKSVFSQWEELASFSGKDPKKSFLIEGSRGKMMKCCCCGCVIHEKCLDCPSYHIITSDSQFACPYCCTFGDI